MTSWRHTVSEQVQHDLDELLGSCVGFAQQQLARHGEVFPYAAAIGTHGQVEMIAPLPDLTTSQPESAAIIASCEAALVDEREALRAAAVVADVRAVGGDCIQVNLEHAEGPALTVLLPYTRETFHGTVDYGQLTAAAAVRRIWVS